MGIRYCTLFRDSQISLLIPHLPGTVVDCYLFTNRNIDGRLPESPGRVWYEADFDYMGGFRNNRIIYPNDGLVFVTHDHYLTFSEVYWEDNYDDLYD